MYKLRNGKIIEIEEIRALENSGLNENGIAKVYGISRMGLFKARIKFNVPKRFRADKGTHRIPIGDQRERKNAYMRDYYHTHKVLSSIKRFRITAADLVVAESLY